LFCSSSYLTENTVSLPYKDQLHKQNFTTICPVGVAALHAERQMTGWTDTAKPVVAFHNCVANMPINDGYTKFI